MIQSMNSNGEIVQAQFAERNTDYYCTVCQQKVVLRRGAMKLPHFSHRSIYDCFSNVYRKESLSHLQGKYMLYRMFGAHHASLEYFISEIEQIPDILLKEGVALELQLSIIPAHIIASRTAGYRSLDMKVCWITDYHSVKLKGNILTLNYFQQSLIYYPSHTLFALDIAGETFYALKIQQVVGRFKYKVQRFTVQSKEVLFYHMTHSLLQSEHRVMNDRDVQQYVRNCIAKRSVLEPTLSALYQLNIRKDNIPLHYRIILPEQMLLNAHPIYWQLELQRMVSHNAFTLEAFNSVLNIHPAAKCYRHELSLCTHILQEYYRISKQIRAISVEK